MPLSSIDIEAQKRFQKILPERRRTVPPAPRAGGWKQGREWDEGHLGHALPVMARRPGNSAGEGPGGTATGRYHPQVMAYTWRALSYKNLIIA
jgi:hypothetical protein